MGVIKFLRDISGLFNWNTDDNPTSEQDYMNAVKNWQETEKNLVDSILWQPTTAYAVGDQVKTPTLGSQYVLVCTAAGTSGANELDYSEIIVGGSITDGTVTWLVGTLATAGGDSSSAGYPMLMLYDTTDSTFATLQTSYFGTQLIASKPRTGGAIPFDDGAALVLYPKTSAYKNGEFSLTANDGNNSTDLCGTPTGGLTWNGNPIQTSSDKRLKQDFSAVPDKVLDAWGKIDWIQYKFIADVERKGDLSRWHTGIVAQDIKNVGEQNNVDLCEYGILCHDEWEADEKREAGDRWTVRYEEALAMEVIYQRRRADRLEKRIEELEKMIKSHT